jgi:density-regulated protein DRP1
MSAFGEEGEAPPASEEIITPSAPADVILVDYASPRVVSYCPHCSMPTEYCQYGPQFKEKCLPHMKSTLTEEELARALGQASLEGGIVDVGPKKSRVTTKEAAILETKIVIARIQRQKKKFDTSVLGLETVPGIKLEDAAKFFKKKFSCGASVGKTAAGAPQVTIQGDVSLELPDRLMQEYKVAPSTIFFLEGKGELRSFA